jgi:hypothetical protein
MRYTQPSIAAALLLGVGFAGTSARAQNAVTPAEPAISAPAMPVACGGDRLGRDGPS